MPNFGEPVRPFPARPRVQPERPFFGESVAEYGRRVNRDRRLIDSGQQPPIRDIGESTQRFRERYLLWSNQVPGDQPAPVAEPEDRAAPNAVDLWNQLRGYDQLINPPAIPANDQQANPNRDGWGVGNLIQLGQPAAIPEEPRERDLERFNNIPLDPSWTQWLNAQAEAHERNYDVIEENVDAIRDRLSRDGENGIMIERYLEYFRGLMTEKAKKSAVKTKPEFLSSSFKKIFAGRRIKVVKGEIGIEIEAEGRNLFNSPIQYWGAINDHSLRQVDGHPPIEYVLRQPIERKEVLPALEYLSHQLKKHKSELVMSHRCSVHVHVNIQPMLMLDLIKFICLYYILEDVLIEWSGPNRKGNLFCLRASDAAYQVELLVDALKTGNWNQVFSQEYRYSAMNMASMGVHGSLEFRSMQGNVNIETINNWVTILAALKDAVDDFKNPETIGRMINSLGSRAFMIKVLDGRVPPSVLKTMLGYGNLDKMIHDGFVTMKDIIYAVDWNNPPKWMKSVSENIGGRGGDEAPNRLLRNRDDDEGEE